MRFAKRRSTRTLITFVAALGLLLAACGDGATDPADDAPDAGADEPAGEPDEEPEEEEPEASGNGTDGEELVVGVLLGLTGLAPETGEAARVAIEVAAEEINDAGGIDGRPVRLVISDTESDPTTATLELSRLLDSQGVEVVVGPMFSQESLAVMPVLNEREVFNIHQTGAVELTPEVGQFSFGNLMNAGAVARKMASYTIEEFNPERVAIVHDPGAQALSAVEVYEDEFEAAGVEVTASVEHDYGVTDMTPTMLQVTRGDPEVIVMFESNGGDLGNLLIARQELGRTGIPVVANNAAGAVQGVALEVAGGDETIFEGVTGVTASSFATCDESAGGAPLEFKETVAEYVGEEPRFALAHASLFYDALYMIKAAIEGTDGSTDAPTLRDWMYDNIQTFEGVYSGLSASPDSHFLVGIDGLEIIHPLPILEGGMTLSVDC
jgi:branched-chain amino acid transport system substrate-binding protein